MAGMIYFLLALIGPFTLGIGIFHIRAQNLIKGITPIVLLFALPLVYFIGFRGGNFLVTRDEPVEGFVIGLMVILTLIIQAVLWLVLWMTSRNQYDREFLRDISLYSLISCGLIGVVLPVLLFILLLIVSALEVAV